MFRQLLAILKKGDLVSQALQNTNEMLDKAHIIFDLSVGSIADKKKPGQDIYQLDKEINALEKKIRRKVLEHLSINPQQDLIASLVLTSVIISIERIGDYSKNIYELLDLYEDSDKIRIDEKLRKDAQIISATFADTKKIFKTGDRDEALELMKRANPLKKDFDLYIGEIAKKKYFKPRDAVANVLFSRFLKRVTAHLENICSGIANPFELIGFYKQNDEEAD